MPRCDKHGMADFYPDPIDEIIINTKTYFHMDEELFELGNIKNGFAKCFAKVCNLTIVSHVMIIYQNDTLLYYIAIKFHCTEC